MRLQCRQVTWSALVSVQAVLVVTREPGPAGEGKGGKTQKHPRGVFPLVLGDLSLEVDGWV